MERNPKPNIDEQQKFEQNAKMLGQLKREIVNELTNFREDRNLYIVLNDNEENDLTNKYSKQFDITLNKNIEDVLSDYQTLRAEELEESSFRCLLSIIAEKYPNATCENTIDTGKKEFKKIDIKKDKEYQIVPINNGHGHWVLLIVDNEKKNFICFDPKGNFFDTIRIETRLKDNGQFDIQGAKRKLIEKFFNSDNDRFDDYNVENVCESEQLLQPEDDDQHLDAIQSNAPQKQGDNVNCGIYCIKFAELFLEHPHNKPDNILGNINSSNTPETWRDKYIEDIIKESDEEINRKKDFVEKLQLNHHYKPNEQSIIKIQALFRGFRVRKQQKTDDIKKSLAEEIYSEHKNYFWKDGTDNGYNSVERFVEECFNDYKTNNNMTEISYEAFVGKFISPYEDIENKQHDIIDEVIKEKDEDEFEDVAEYNKYKEPYEKAYNGTFRLDKNDIIDRGMKIISANSSIKAIVENPQGEYTIHPASEVPMDDIPFKAYLGKHFKRFLVQINKDQADIKTNGQLYTFVYYREYFLNNLLRAIKENCRDDKEKVEEKIDIISTKLNSMAARKGLGSKIKEFCGDNIKQALEEKMEVIQNNDIKDNESNFTGESAESQENEQECELDQNSEIRIPNFYNNKSLQFKTQNLNTTSNHDAEIDEVNPDINSLNAKTLISNGRHQYFRQETGGYKQNGRNEKESETTRQYRERIYGNKNTPNNRERETKENCRKGFDEKSMDLIVSSAQQIKNKFGGI